jgi:hypothetical protein
VSGSGWGGDATNRGLRSTLILLAVLVVYTELFAPVREHRDLLLMDLRGTGTVTVDGRDVEAHARCA